MNGKVKASPKALKLYSAGQRPKPKDDTEAHQCRFLVQSDFGQESERPSVEERANEMLRLSEARFNEVQRLARIGSWDWDLVSDTFHWSDVLFELLGLDPGATTPTINLLLSRIHPDDRPAVELSIERGLKQGGQVSFDFRYYGPNNQVRYGHIKGVVLVDNHGQPFRAHGTGQDITERKLTDKPLTRARELLEQRVEERTRELAATNEQLQMERQTLHRKNVALQEVLGQIESGKRDLALQIQLNVDRIALPLITALEGRVDECYRHHLGLLRNCLEELTAPFVDRLERTCAELAPRELEICHMVKNGFDCKQIAATSNTSVQTVLKQRKQIRKKLGIAKKRINLSSFLRSITLNPPDQALRRRLKNNHKVA
ncbi:MAG: PAS domain-containing protein [bacterium]